MTRGRFRMLRCGLAGVEAVEAETGHRFPRHTHEQFGLGVIRRGAQRSLSGRGVVEAGAGDVITVNPGEVHDGEPIGDDGRTWRILYIDPSLIAASVQEVSDGTAGLCEFPNPVIRDVGLASRLERLFTVVTDGLADSGARQEEMLLIVLTDVLRDHVAVDTAQSVPGAIAAARSLMDDDPTAPITLADLARASGLSRFQVLRGFVRATGLTPHAYLVQRRIHAARRLIAQGTPLAEAAAASGFADQSHMTRVFVRRFGISPGAYADAIA